MAMTGERQAGSQAQWQGIHRVIRGRGPTEALPIIAGGDGGIHRIMGSLQQWELCL